MSKENLIRRVELAMLEKYDFRLHKNRTRLVNFLRLNNSSASHESIVRAQRKLWSLGKCLPEGNDLLEWCRFRRVKYAEFKERYR